MNGPEGTNQNAGAGGSSPPPSPASTPAPVAPPQALDPPHQEHPTWTTESAPPPKEKKSHLWLWILLGVFLALVIAGVVAAGVLRSNTADVPDLEGLSISQAVRELNEVELDLGKVDYSSEVPLGFEEGQVISQDPAAGEQVEHGTAVDVVVAGKAEVEVPEVLGLSADEATQTLEGAGFIVKRVDVENDAEVGTVVDQSPGGGEMVAPGSEVTILVSAGVTEALIPNVVGLSQEEATQVLQDAGYQVQARGSFDDQVAEGVVITQSPEGGTSAEAGTRVDIIVSQGENPQVQVPNVVGMTEADAAQALEGAGLEVVPGPAYSDTVPVGQVIAQDPGAGTTVNRGSAVTVTVSQGPQPPETATVPNVVGQQEADAVSSLQGAGYQVAIVEVYTELVPTQVVALQSPAGGSVTEPGITVGILVSQGPRPPEFVIVPDVVGMTLEEATAALEEVGLAAESVEIYTSLAPEGELFAQLPPPDSSVAPGSTVFVIISRGAYPVVNPL